MLEKKDPLACCSMEKNVLKEWVKGATVLKCNARIVADPARAAVLGWTGCRADMNYVLAALDARPSEPWTTVPAASDGYLRFKLVEWSPENLTQPATIVETDASTWYGIENLLSPVTIKGNTNNCGVYFLPYETLSEGTAVLGVDGHDTPAVSFVDIEWDKTSYAHSGKRKATGDYSMLDKSTIHYKQTTFTGPFDFDAK
jgi:hypothetical protein